ncbi:hypothetical protein E2C01_073381 [Portunus trituberculatus]|uniref:Uncharacterized protein n=1 Tax=Portunus trituberculatus TaxID=210409 RepID=A0A5B7IAF1_PORTR|nr:hypothetical protein [Portunus trituberculatus]
MWRPPYYGATGGGVPAADVKNPSLPNYDDLHILKLHGSWPLKGRGDVSGVSERLDELVVPFLLARFALGGYGGSVLWNKSLGQIALTKAFKSISGAQSKVIGLVGTFKTLWERTPCVGGI